MSQYEQQRSICKRALALLAAMALLPPTAGCLNALRTARVASGDATLQFRDDKDATDTAEKTSGSANAKEATVAQADGSSVAPPARSAAPVVKRASGNRLNAKRSAVTLVQKPTKDGRPSASKPNPSLIHRANWDGPLDDDPLAEPSQDPPERVEPTDDADAPLPDGEMQRRRLPVGERSLADSVKISRNQDRISLTVRDAPIGAVLGLIAEQHGLNIVAGDSVNMRISVTMSDVKLEDALDTILSVNGYAWTQQNDIIIVSEVSAEGKGFPAVQGRMVRVYPLNYVAANDVDKIVKGLLSPVGQSFVVQTNSTDSRRTTEQLVVEDLPPYIERVDAYLAETDVRPRQVMVEAHILQVTLKDETKHGVKFDQMLQAAGSTINIGTPGFASAAASPAGLITVSGENLSAVIECLKATTDAKTLASPKLAVLNGQEANIQIGGKLGYLLTTTVQTTSMQSVNFLDFGVILKVSAIITADNRILLSVKPQVSSARLNPANNLPESETTELDTKVILADGQAIVIGGLIKETNNDAQNKVPYLGDLWGVGRLFQRRQALRQRDEIIITLLPTIVPDEFDSCSPEVDAVDRAHSPLLLRPLEPADRRVWEPQLIDASQGPREKKWIKSGSPYPPRPLWERDIEVEGGYPIDEVFIPDAGGNAELLPPGDREIEDHAAPQEPLRFAPPMDTLQGLPSDDEDPAADADQAKIDVPTARRFGHLLQSPTRRARVSSVSHAQKQSSIVDRGELDGQ